MRFSQPTKRLQAELAPGRLILWDYAARLVLASAIFVAALTTWQNAESAKTLVSTLTFVGALFFTAGSFTWSEVRRRPLTEGFYYLQLVMDLLVVTAIVHVTEGAQSGFAALYILVNAAAALILPIGGALLVAALGDVMYVADALVVSAGSVGAIPLLLQLAAFTLVAVGTSYISAQLREAGIGRAELAAELTRVRLREADILRNIRSGIITVNDAGELLFANPVAGELLGLRLDDRIGAPVLETLRPVAPSLAESLERAIRHREHAARTEGVVRRGDRAFPLGVTTTSADGAGTALGRTTTAIFQDISDQKRLEQLNLRAQRLEAVTELSASLAHEIKNPLASIRSAVEQMSARPMATADERTLGNLIVRESDRLSRLLSEFLDFARVRVTRREPVNLGEVVRDAARLAATHPGRAGDSRLAVELRDEPLVVIGDEDLLHRAVFNLVLNAVQATRAGTEVRLVAHAADPALFPRGVPFVDDAIAVEISDSGPGIVAAVQDRLFEPFTTTKEDGSGLGLAIAHRAIEAHRGVVLVDTDERGTRFTVLLPRTSATNGANS